MSDNFTQEGNPEERNAGDTTMEDDNEESADERILDSEGDLMSGQPSPQAGHSSRKRSHSHSDNTNGRKGKQPLKKTNRQPRLHNQSPSNKRPRRPASDEISLLERKIEKSEQSISKLKTHMDKGTCPKDLRYVAKANIFADEEFKNDVRALRKEAEQKFVGALTRFHYRRVERNQAKLRSAKSRKPENGTNTNRARTGERPQLGARSANSFPESIKSITANLDKRLQEVNVMMKKLEDMKNKTVEDYPCLLSVCETSEQRGDRIERRKLKNIKHRERKKKTHKDITAKKTESNRKYIKNLSDSEMTTDQVNLLSRGLNFVPTPITNETALRTQLIKDFKDFARRMRLQFIYHGEDNNIHPFYVKSDWEPPVQKSVALESYLEEIKVQLAQIPITKPKHNLPLIERKAITELKNNSEINIKKADKGTTTVIMNKQKKVKEGQVLLDDRNNYTPLEEPMVEETSQKVKQITEELYQGGYIDKMTVKWLSQTPNPPRVPVFYTLTKIHKPTMVGRPIISGNDGPTERISAFVDNILQPIAKSQKSYLKDTTDFINFIERTTLPEGTFLVSLDVTSLYTNIPQEEGIHTACRAFENFYGDNTPIPTHSLKKILRLILQENSFEFNDKNYLQIHGTAMGTGMAVAFANIFMSSVETEIISQSKTKPLEWKRYIDDIFSLWNADKKEIEEFIVLANRHHLTIKFTAEISNKEVNFLDTTVYKGERFYNQGILDIRTHFKPTETFQYTYFSSCHPAGVRKGLIKGEALRLLRTNSSEKSFDENITNFKTRLRARGYPHNLIEKITSEVKFTERKSALQQNEKVPKKILPFVTTYHPALHNLKDILMSKWHLIQNQPLLRKIFKEPPLISYKKGKSLRDILVRAKL